MTTNTDAVPLKPCPFCCSDDLFTKSALGRRQVVCETCEASGPTEETDEEAIEAWNRLGLSHSAEIAPTPAAQADGAATGAMTRATIQGGAIEHGFQYWRASDAHGVTGTKPQAIELLQDLLGVEVEIEDNGCQTCDGTGMIGGPSFYAPDEGGEPCPDCAAIAAGGAQEPIYQESLVGGSWIDVPKERFDAIAPEYRRALYAAPLPRVAATVALTDEQREALHEAIAWANDDGLPGTADMLRSILAASKGEQS